MNIDLLYVIYASLVWGQFFNKSYLGANFPPRRQPS
jgi:hypothetical protein